ncbi:MAG: amidase family protein, partial [Pseudomonadota bacterium]
DVDLGAVSLAGRRFAVVEDVALEDLEPVVQSAFEESLTRIEAAGAQVDRVSLPEVSALIGLAPLLYAPEAYGAWKDVIEAAPDKMFAEIRERFRGGADVSAPDYVAALQEMARLRDAIWAQLGGYDAMLVPASPILPPKMADVEDGGDVYKRANLMALRNTRIGNMTDAASVTVPSGVASCGVMLIGPGGSDARMLRLAAALEAAF